MVWPLRSECLHPYSAYSLFSCRPEICDSQCQGGELCDHILQRWLLRDDGLLQTGYHAEAMHLRLPPRWPHGQGGHQPGVPGCAWLRGAQGGDHLLPEGWWVSGLAQESGCHSASLSREGSFFFWRVAPEKSTYCGSSLCPLHDAACQSVANQSVTICAPDISPDSSKQNFLIHEEGYDETKNSPKQEHAAVCDIHIPH